DNAALTAALTQHAGQVDATVPTGDFNNDLGSNPHSDALMFNARHGFSNGLEAYFDTIYLRSQGEALRHGFLADGQAFILSGSPANPFTDDISVYFPITGMTSFSEQRSESLRVTAGLSMDLPFGWRGNIEANTGGFHRHSVSSSDLPEFGSF